MIENVQTDRMRLHMRGVSRFGLIYCYRNLLNRQNRAVKRVMSAMGEKKEEQMWEYRGFKLN